MENVVQTTEITAPEHDIGFFQRYLICGYFLLAFFEPYLNGVLGSIAKYYILLLIGVLCLSNRKLRIQPFHWCFLGWLVFKITSVLWSTNLYIPNLHLFSQLGMVALLIVLTAIPLDGKTINKIVNTMWLGSSVIGVFSLFLSRSYHGTVASRQVLYLFGQETDPNNQAAFLLIGLTISLYNLVVLRKYRVLSISTIIVNAYSLFMTGSRGGLISLMCVGIVLLFTSSNRKHIVNKIKLILIIALICGALFYIANRFLPMDIFERLFAFSSYEGGSERDIIWKNGWQLLTSELNFLFGAGWGAYYGYNGFYVAMHNTYLSMLCDVGIVGCLIFFVPICKAIFRLLKNSEPFSVLLLTCGFVPSFFLEAINKRFFWNVIIFLFIIYVKKDNIDDNQKHAWQNTVYDDRLLFTRLK